MKHIEMTPVTNQFTSDAVSIVITVEEDKRMTISVGNTYTNELC